MTTADREIHVDVRSIPRVPGQPGRLARDVWEHQFKDVHAALAPYERVTSDGFHYVDPQAPHQLQDLYRSLCSTGYLYGWLRSIRYIVERSYGNAGWQAVPRTNPAEGVASWSTRHDAEHARDVFASDLGWHVRVALVVDGMADMRARG